MPRRFAPVLLAALLLGSTLPVHAVEPGNVAAPSPSAEPTPPPSPEPPADPSAGAPEPSADAAPSSPVPADPSADPSAEASAPLPAESPEPAPAASADAAAEPVDTGSPTGRSTAGVDATGRYIVLLKEGSDAQSVATAHGRGAGVKADRLFKAVKGYAARLSAGQHASLARDPSVAAIVPDEVVGIAAQSMPTGVARIGGRTSLAASIDGVDKRVDADVAIVDTGIDPAHPDLNVVGGVNCSSSDRAAWRDRNGHGTHVAGTVAAIDDAYGVVGVAPGARLWAVKILGDDGSGLLSWYVCGLDWIAAQRDPLDSSRPLIESVNMSVAKWGRDDGDCGNTNNDILHKAICRLTATGVTVVAAAANDSGNAAFRVPAAYDEVITVSALADTDGRAGGLGGNKCWSWGTYDQDDTFADFSNYGADVDLIAPGKCIWSTLPGNRYGWSSGTSMAAPHVAGAVALYTATRPWATPADVKEALVHLASTNWIRTTDPDGRPDPLLDVSRIGPYGDFSLAFGSPGPVVEPGATTSLSVAVKRSATFFERISLEASAPAGFSVSLDRSTLYGFDAASAGLTVTVPSETAGGVFPISVTGTEHGRTRTATIKLSVVGRLAGGDRFETAAAVSAATFAPGTAVAYVANAYAFPDALAGAAAAGTVRGPVLYAAPRGTLHPATVAELKRLKPVRIVVLGSSAVISDAVAGQLAAYTSGAVRRLAGSDRFRTAAAVSAATFAPGAPVAYIANAFSFPDALSAAAAAGTVRGPVLYSAATGTLNSATAAELRRLKPQRIVVLGGMSVISDGLAKQLAAYTAGGVKRLAGADRFATAAAVSAATFAPGAAIAYIANAYTFPDALAGAAAAGTVKGPVLYAAASGTLDAATAAELARLQPKRIVALGSRAVVADSVLVQLAPYVAAP